MITKIAPNRAASS